MTMNLKTIAAAVGGVLTILTQILTQVQPVLPADWSMPLAVIGVAGTALAVHILPAVASAAPTLEAQAEQTKVLIARAVEDLRAEKWAALAVDKSEIVREVRAAVLLDLPFAQSIASQAAAVVEQVHAKHSQTLGDVLNYGVNAGAEVTAPIPVAATAGGGGATAAAVPPPAPVPLTAGAQAAADARAGLR